MSTATITPQTTVHTAAVDPAEGSDPMLTITHTHESGTLIDGTARGDGTADPLKANGWRWGRSISAWYVPQSRDGLPKTWIIERTVTALREAGFEVAVEIDTTHRPAAEVEAGKIARQADRVAALDAKAERRQDAADAADTNLRRRLDALPPMGEPVKIGHHSEGRHRAAIKRADGAFRKSIEADAAADYAAERACIAGTTTAARYAPQAVARRIETLTTEARGIRRKLDGYSHNFGGGYIETYAPAEGSYRDRLTAQLDETDDKLTYWQAIRAAQLESGEVGDYSPETISKGDRVLYFREWCEVIRVNPKSVSVLMRSIPLADGTPSKASVRYPDIHGHKRPDRP